MVWAMRPCDTDTMRDAGFGVFSGPRRGLLRLSLATAWVAAGAGACATGVNTLDPGGESAADAGGSAVVTAGTGGKPGTAGSSSNATAGAAGAGGTKVVNAFGGTASSGGSTAKGGAAGSTSGGAAGSGGKASGGGAGAGGKSGGGAGGTASAGGSSGATASGGSAGSGSLACLASWKGDACDTCSKQTQGDKLACMDILDCYAANACSPTTCGSNDGKCGVNKIAKGTAGYPIAQDVYTCLCK